MKRNSDLRFCLFISLIMHGGFIGSFALNPDIVLKDKPFEVTYEVEEEKFPEVYDIQEKKRMEPPKTERDQLIEPVPDESINEETKRDQEDEELKKSFLRYQDSIKQKIQQEKQYPRWALRSSHEGRARISFSVLSDGQIQGLKLLDSSGFEELDKEALSAVKRACPFEAFPSKFNYGTIEVEIDIVFKMALKKRISG